jgi:hypothetical protein
MKFKLALAAILVCALASLVGFTSSASAQATPGLTTTCVTANCLTQSTTGTAPNGVTYDLTSTVTRFANRNGSLVAVVTTTGTANGSSIGTITSEVPVSQLAADPPSCTILDLTLGPLHLDLLGLVVDLNQVHLTITGQTGPGNLLGNLLCGLANALNGNHAGGLATLLNRLFGL